MCGEGGEKWEKGRNGDVRWQLERKEREEGGESRGGEE